MNMFIRLLLFVTLGFSLLEASVGKITALSGKATLERGSSTIPVTLGSSLEAKDSIITTNDAKVQLTFNDNTIITVGKKSKFSIEEYLFDATTESTAKFNMVNGTIRAMSGKIGKIAPDRFAVKTKTATIGIRGTDFIIQTSPTGESQFFCMQGAITIQSSDGAGMILIPAGSYITISPSGSISEVKEFTPAEVNTLLQNGLSATTVHTNEETTKIDLDSVVEFVAQTSSEPQGESLNIQNLITEVGYTLTTENLSNPTDMTPKIFTGFTTFLDRPQGVGSVGSGGGTLTLTSIPSSQSVTGTIDLPSVYKIIHLGSINSYNTVDTFDVKLASIEMSGVETPLISPAHLWTTSEPEQNDYLSWGEWAINPDPMIDSADRIVHGFWVAGVQTPSSIINGFRYDSVSMTYSGNVIGEVQTVNADGTYISSAPISGGTINMFVDFGADSFSADIQANEYRLGFSGEIFTNKLNGSLNTFSNVAEDFFNSASGTLQGAFYGADGKTAGGTFNAQADTDPMPIQTIIVQGAFKAAGSLSGQMSPP